MKFIFFFLPLFLSAAVYDCFMFNHELDILEIRLNELYDYVDHFVLVECAETHQGKPKPFYFEQNKNRFAQYNNKIIHIKVTERLQTDDLWLREGWQRNQILRGLYHCFVDDIIMISDLDEIPRGKDMPRILSHIKTHPIFACQLDLFVHYLNGYVGQWNGPVITQYYLLPPNYMPNALRSMRNNLPVVANAGWHFSSMGGVKANQLKLESNVHGAERPIPTQQQLELTILETPCIPVDSLFPQCVIDHLDWYIQNGWVRTDCTLTREAIETKVHP